MKSSEIKNSAFQAFKSEAFNKYALSTEFRGSAVSVKDRGTDGKGLEDS